MEDENCIVPRTAWLIWAILLIAACYICSRVKYKFPVNTGVQKSEDGALLQAMRQHEAAVGWEADVHLQESAGNRARVRTAASSG